MHLPDRTCDLDDLDEGWRQTLAAFLLGAMATALLFGWFLGFDARSLRWQWGAAGEEWTAGELKKLGPDWRVYHDIPDGHANWDHIVIGPTGVFAIDSKNLSQPATVDATGLRSGRLRYGGSSTRGSAARMKEVIEQQTGVSVWVQGVVAVWGDLPDGAVKRDKVLYVPGPQLANALRGRVIRTTDRQRDSAALALDRLLAHDRRP